MVALPSRTSGYKILYTRSYKAEIAGDNSLTCKMCLCSFAYFVQRWTKKPDPCSCSKQSISL